MLQSKLAGPGAAARKYDLITALGAHALSMTKHEQRLVLRLITLLTARYNWGRDELCIGQREIARLWHCDTRTVKRELAKLRGLGWLLVKKQGARGRVGTYQLDIAAILNATRNTWEAVGPDFAIRLDGGAEQKVVPFSPAAAPPPVPDPESSEWGLARAILYQQDTSRFGAWLNALKRSERAGGRLILKAPSRFHAAYVQTHLQAAILNACRAVDDTVNAIEIID